MPIKSILLQSVAIFALATAAAAAAERSTSFSDRFPAWYFSAEGGAIFAKPAVSTDKLGGDHTAPTLGEEVGGYAALAFGHDLTPNSDWRVSLAYSTFADNSASTDPSMSPVVTLASTLQFATADLEAGFRQAKAMDLNWRFFGGLRVLDSRDSADKVGSGASHVRSKFLGAGPRVGADFDRMFSAGPWGFSGTLSGAAIFGQRGITRDSNPTSKSNEIVYDLEGSFGLDLQVPANGVFTVGVRAQQWWNLREANANPDLFVKPDVLDWGPFVRFVKHL
jgi:hypothetical protein